MFKNMRLDILFDMFLNPSFKMMTSFANVARATASTSKFIYSQVLNTRGGRLLIFRIFSNPPDLIKTHPPPPPLEEASLTLPQCYVEEKSVKTKK